MDLTRARLRLHFGSFTFGPGKADLLEAIAAEGSISAAGRRMKMSYKRAWSLVESMNAHYAEPLVESTRGGSHGGGARLTAKGEAILAAYRALMARLLDTGAAEIAALGQGLHDSPAPDAPGDSGLPG